MTLLLQLFPDGPGKVQSCVVRRFWILSPVALIVHWIATPSGVTLAPGIFRMESGRRGSAQLCATSLLKALSRACLFAVSEADLWFPLVISVVMSLIRSVSDMSRNGYETPFVMMSLIFSPFGWAWSSDCIAFAGLNSAPYERTVLSGDCVAASRSKFSFSSRFVFSVAASMDLVKIHGLGWIGVVSVAISVAKVLGRSKCLMDVMSMMSEGRQWSRWLKVYLPRDDFGAWVGVGVCGVVVVLVVVESAVVEDVLVDPV